MFANAIAVALVGLPFLVSAVLAETCSRTYVVKEGDWCDTISASHNVSTYQLSTVNAGIDDLCSNLEIGWNLCLGFSGTDCQSIYVVQPGDTVDAIASARGLNSSILLANNPQLEADSSNLYVGEVLAVCSSVTAPAATSGSTGSSIPSNASPASGDEWCD